MFSGGHNKDTSFDAEEREALKLRGLLPPCIETMDNQVARCTAQLRSFDSAINRYIYLAKLREQNETLFYRVLLSNVTETMPVIYTPTVGEACVKFANIFRNSEGMYLSAFKDRGMVRRILDNWPADGVDIIVVTDGSRILGLGDLGINGMGIPVGKLSLYVVASGFHPRRTLPITLDTGTNNAALRENPFYLGERQPRMGDEGYYEFVEEFVQAVKDKWPNAILQWEDFSNDHCFTLLEKYRKELCTFNDDIQGTGAVVLAGFINAARMIKLPLKEARIVFLGAGSASVGVANYICGYIAEETGVSLEEARSQVWMADSRGMVTADRGDKLDAHKVPYARTDNNGTQMKGMLPMIKYTKANVIIGLSGTCAGHFDQEVMEEMLKYTDRPIIFPLSNPTSKAECTAEQAYTWTQGKAVFASGSPFDPVTLDGTTYFPGQGNNMYIFPGVGFGASLCAAREITDKMLIAAARMLAGYVTDDELAKGMIYPSLENIREISAHVAAGVIHQAAKEGLCTNDFPVNDSHDQVVKVVQDHMYIPEYL